MCKRKGLITQVLMPIWRSAAVWWSRVPPALVHEHQTIVARIIDLGLREEGVPQSELQRETRDQSVKDEAS